MLHTVGNPYALVCGRSSRTLASWRAGQRHAPAGGRAYLPGVVLGPDVPVGARRGAPSPPRQRVSAAPTSAYLLPGIPLAARAWRHAVPNPVMRPDWQATFHRNDLGSIAPRAPVLSGAGQHDEVMDYASAGPGLLSQVVQPWRAGGVRRRSARRGANCRRAAVCEQRVRVPRRQDRRTHAAAALLGTSSRRPTPATRRTARRARRTGRRSPRGCERRRARSR